MSGEDKFHDRKARDKSLYKRHTISTEWVVVACVCIYWRVGGTTAPKVVDAARRSIGIRRGVDIEKFGWGPNEE